MPSASTALRATETFDIAEVQPSPRDLKIMARRLAVHCAVYRGAIPTIAFWQLGSTLALFTVVIGLMFLTVQNYYWLTLPLSVPAGGLLVRLFIIQHDCGHGSFLKGRLANDVVGRIVSVLTVTPYEVWRREHAKHHATSGNLEERGIGDIDTLTVREYEQLSPWRKRWYRLYRNPLFLFGFAVPFYFIVLQRVPIDHPLPRHQAWASVMSLNGAMVALYAVLAYFVGFWNLLFVAVPVVHIASAIGGWLFFVQHQFDEAHWNRPPDWDQQVAALFGSSYYKLPAVLNWFTGNIGLHHIHHLNSMIPNYRLMACLRNSPDLQGLNQLTLWESFKCVRYKLWCEDRRMLVGFDGVAA